MEIINFNDSRRARNLPAYKDDVRATFASMVAEIKNVSVYTPESPDLAERDIEHFHGIAKNVRKEDFEI